LSLDFLFIRSREKLNTPGIILQQDLEHKLRCEVKLVMETPKAGWTQTTDVVKWAEDFSSFLSREKASAQRCLHDCERLLNDPNVKSDSLRDGLRELMSKTEDNFGTLLHLERVINMKNHGDFTQHHNSTPSMAIRQKSQSSSSAAVAGSAPQFTQTGRFRQQRIRSIDFAGGDFLKMKRDSRHSSGGTDENFDDFIFNENNHEETPFEPVDDLDDDSGFPEAAYKARPTSGEKVIAKSMPMNVPDQRKLMMDFPEIDEDTQDIPTKIAELARSLHVDAIGELPSPRLVE